MKIDHWDKTIQLTKGVVTYQVNTIANNNKYKHGEVQHETRALILDHTVFIYTCMHMSLCFLSPQRHSRGGHLKITSEREVCMLTYLLAGFAVTHCLNTVPTHACNHQIHMYM